MIRHARPNRKPVTQASSSMIRRADASGASYYDPAQPTSDQNAIDGARPSRLGHQFDALRFQQDHQSIVDPPKLSLRLQRQPETADAGPTGENAPPTATGATGEEEVTASPSGLERVLAATAANDLTALIAIQHDLRRQMQTNPLNPPQDARDGLATARHWTMDRIAAIRDTYEPLIATASTGATLGVDATGPLETIEILMDAECTPYLDALLEGDPQYRYEHFKTDVAEKVFAAVRLHSARRALGQIGHRAEAEAEAREHGKLPKGAWCGAFAYTQAEQAGGFDSNWAADMQGEAGIRTALAYGGAMATTWIWAFDHWENLKKYHASRGSERWYEAIFRTPPSRGIKAGDIVLIDNNYGNDPDHVTTAVSFDGRFLTTVGGNQGSSDPKDESGVSRSAHAIDLQNNPDPKDIRKTGSDGKRIPQTVDPALGPKNVRVHGIGRWSIVDYERHIYRVNTAMPTQPPSVAELQKLG